MKYFVTGCAGFVGSNLVDRLLSLGHEVVGYDNLSTGKINFMFEALKNTPKFKFYRGDLLSPSFLEDIMADVDVVFHLAANADVRYGLDHPTKDLEQNTIATSNVLEAMRKNGVEKIIFSSTGSVYGDQKIFPISEDAPFPIQTSLYGASKLACEGLITAYSYGFGIQSYIFRFVSLIGERYTHGHIIDFYKKLKKDPSSLEIIGDGKQKKSYLYIQDCLDAIFMALENRNEKVNIFNLGHNSYCTVDESAKWICDKMGVDPVFKYTGQTWVGDNRFIWLENSKMKCVFGDDACQNWYPKTSIKEGIEKTIDWLKENENWLLRTF